MATWLSVLTRSFEPIGHVIVGKINAHISALVDDPGVIPGGVVPQCGSKGKEGDELNVAQGNS